jgi:hypothetical protein
MLVDINGVYVNPELVAVVRESSLDSDQTVIFTAGQSAVDSGHLIDEDIEIVIESLNTAQMQMLAERLLADADESVE